MTGAKSQTSDGQWLATLIAPGTSVGGSRPKANFRDKDGSLWIAKFPSRDDRRNIAAWEGLVHDLAKDCKVDLPQYRLARLQSSHQTFCSRRFDRTREGRRFFVSAMTLLERADGEGGSYVEIAEFIVNQGAQGTVKSDLEQLFRRVIFNVLVGNTDDHLRNHGFIREPSGWRLAPAYDLNPNPARRTHALRLDDLSDVPEIDAVLRTAALYRLDQRSASRILDQIRKVTQTWRQRARAARLPLAEIAGVEAAFVLST
jgi:serine/threonine-protein kinase HipA